MSWTPRLRAHLEDPHTIAITGLLFLTWGRKPDSAQRNHQSFGMD